MATLSKSDLERIEASVKEAESKTSGEIVVLYLKGSDSYAWSYFAWGAIGIGIATLFASAISLWGWGLTGLQFLEWQLVGWTGGLAASPLPFLRRLIIPKRLMVANVHQAALAAFTSHAVFETRDRTGILICLCDFEHLVEIVADKGIHQKLGTPYWEQIASGIAGRIKKGDPANGVIDAIGEMGEKLAEFFPRRADDSNELPDKPKA